MVNFLFHYVTFIHRFPCEQIIHHNTKTHSLTLTTIFIASHPEKQTSYVEYKT